MLLGRSNLRSKKFNWGLMALALPGMLFLFAIYYVPLFGLVIPFKNIDYSKGILGSDWVDPIFKNFDYFFKSQDALNITRNTLMLNAIFIATTMVLSVALSICMYELGKKRVKLFQTCLFVPYFISWVVASYIMYALLSPDLGVIPQILRSLGRAVPNFYNEPKWWHMFLSLSYIWKNAGYFTLLFYATLIGLDTSRIEAASIDGASRLQSIRFIILPYLQPTIVLLAILQIGRIFYADFGMFFFLPRNSGTLYKATDVFDTYVYRALRVTGDISMSSAMGLFQSVMGFALVLATNLTVKKINKDYALF